MFVLFILALLVNVIIITWHISAGYHEAKELSSTLMVENVCAYTEEDYRNYCL
jgi:hypothetical protein